MKVLIKKFKSLFRLTLMSVKFPYVFLYLKKFEKENKKSIGNINSFFHWKSIAIVWHWKNLFLNEYWKIIDSYDIVIRMNKWFPTKELEKYTWKKTNIWFLWIDPKKFSKNFIPNNYYISKFPILKYNPQKNIVFNIIKNKFIQNKKLYFISSKTYKDLLNIINNWNVNYKQYPTTWFIALYNFIKNYNTNKIWVFWFTFWNTNYFTNTKNFKKSRHNVDLEKEYFFSKLNKENVIYYN